MQKTTRKVAPDGGYAWIACFGVSLVNVSIYLATNRYVFMFAMKKMHQSDAKLNPFHATNSQWNVNNGITKFNKWFQHFVIRNRIACVSWNMKPFERRLFSSQSVNKCIGWQSAKCSVSATVQISWNEFLFFHLKRINWANNCIINAGFLQIIEMNWIAMENGKGILLK